MDVIDSNSINITPQSNNERSIKAEILFSLINNDSNTQNSSKDLIKIFLFELQNILLIIEVAYTNILCDDMNAKLNNTYIFPYQLCRLINISFIVQHNDDNVLMSMDHIYHMIIMILVLFFCSIYIVFCMYIMITSISYYSKGKNSQDNMHNNHNNSNNSYRKQQTNRIKYLRFIIEYHIHIISYYILTWCTYIIEYILIAYNTYTIFYAFILSLFFITSIIIMDLILCILILKYYTHMLANHINNHNQYHGMLSIRNQHGLYIMLLFRLFMPFAFIVKNNNNNSNGHGHGTQDLIIFTIIAMLIIIRYLLVQFKYPIYYDITSIKIVNLSIGSSLGVILAWISSKLLNDHCYNTQRGLMITSCIMLFCPMISKCITGLQDKLVNRIINLSLEKLKDEEIISRYVYFASIFVENCLEPTDEKDMALMKIILKGKLHHHLIKCENCEFANDILYIINNPLIFDSKSYPRARIHILQSILENGIRQNPRSSKLYLLLTEFIIDNDDGFYKSIAMIENTKGMSLSPCQLLSHNVLKFKMNDKINRFNQKRQLNFDQFLLCQKLEQQTLYKLKTQANYHIMFWNLLEEYNDIDMDMIMKLCITIDKEFKEIERCWINEEAIYLKSLYLKPLFIYSIFLQIIKDDICKSEVMLKKYYQFEIKLSHLDRTHAINDYNLCSKKNVFLKVNVHKSQLDEIFYCSKSIYHLLGYTQQEILSRKRIEAIMPGFFHDLHEQYVMNYFNDGKGKAINRLRNTYAQHKQGYLVPIFIFVTIYPHFMEGLYMMSVLRENQIQYDVILISLEGCIISLTKDIMLDWQINHEYFNKFLIWDLCPLLKRIILAYQIILNKKFKVKKREEHFKSTYVKSLNELCIQEEDSEDSFDIDEEKAQKIVDKYSVDAGIVRFELFRARIPMNEVIIEYSLLINAEIYHNNECLLKLILKKLNIQKGPFQRSHNNNNSSLGIIDSRTRISNIIKSMKSINEIKSIDENLGESYKSNINLSRCLVQKTTLPKGISSPRKYDSISNTCRATAGTGGGEGTIGTIGGGIGTERARARIKEGRFCLQKLDFNLNEEEERGKRGLEGIVREYHKHNTLLKKRKTVSFWDSPNDIQYGIKENDIEQNQSYKDSKHEDQSTSYSRSNEVKKIHYRIYQALETPYYPKILQYQLMLIPLFLLTTIGLMIGAEILGQNVSAQGIDYITIINTANQRCLIDIELYKMSRIIWMIKMNLVEKEHFCYLNLDRCQNLLSNQLNPLLETGDLLLNTTTKILEAMADFDTTLQNTFFNYKIKLCNTYGNGTLTNSCFTTDQFKAVNAIHDKAVQVSRFSFANITQNNTDLNYLLGNALGDIGIALQSTSFKISKNMNTLLGQVKALTNNILQYFVPLCGLVWIIIIITSMHMYVKNKRLLQNITSLPGKNSHSQVAKIKNFLKKLKCESNGDFEKTDTRSNPHRKLTATLIKHQSIFTRNINMRKYCFNYLIRFGLLLIAAILVMLIFLLRLVHRTKINEDRNIPLAAIDKSTKQIYYQSLSIAYLYEYIIKNRSSTVMSQNISTALNLAINNISSQQDFSTFFRFRDGEHDPYIDYVLFNNACDILPKTIPNYNSCTIIGGGVSQRGLISLNTYAYQAITSIKDDFDKSTRSKVDMIKALNMQNIQDLQVISYSFIPYYYNYIYELLYLRFKNATNEITNTGYVWIGVCTLCIIVIYWGVITPAMNSLLKEINNIKKIVKIIPKEAILANSVLRQFVKMTSNHKYH